LTLPYINAEASVLLRAMDSSHILRVLHSHWGSVRRTGAAFARVENLLKPVLVLAAGFSLSGCAFLSLYNTTIYQPQVVDIPLIHEKGDTRFDAGSSLYSFEGTL
jgi:hypothetical protein